jgi:hypothetical protein
MKISELLKRDLRLNVEGIDLDVNPLEVYESELFKGDTDYRKAATDYCIKNKIDFTSTSNTLDYMIPGLIVVTCPCCKK